ncbi:WXG100 family type VII secretion target [Rhodococcoides yunnanense]|uniref:WXG100 family type VII secretion target n=1 Tax=Rhodococcoides yunnanense TaxID=278209 RepID=UPI00093497CB|nr:WXG100 family type VII secretion target [Rhodococcus yunnanensis]
MTGEMFVDSAAVRAAVAELDEINESLHTGLRVVRDEVAGLLGSGWSGSSASFFSEHFEDFSRHAAEIVEDADAIAKLVPEAIAGYDRTDTGSASTISSLNL